MNQIEAKQNLKSLCDEIEKLQNLSRGLMTAKEMMDEWHETPFEHLEYTLARNQTHMDILFANMNDVDKFLSIGTDAQVDFYNDSTMTIVQIGESNRSLIQVHGLLLHEAVHVWQRVRTLMGENNPSSEFEAYSIQRIAQDLFAMYKESECDPKQSPSQSSQST